MKNLIFALIQKVATWWSNVTDEGAFAIWFTIWYVPLFMAAMLNTVTSWIVFLVIFTACVIWFIADTVIDHYKKELDTSRKNFKEATKTAMKEVDHRGDSEKRDDRDE